MCVIIYVPKESSISEKEIRDAWSTNPHGAGYSIQKDGKVVFKRGFMKLQSFINEIKPLIGKYNLLLHFRISTSKDVNKMQTHPYKKGDVTLTEGTTTRPVICMNGIISRQFEYKYCNDTMSYIIDHKDAFANINQDILNIIEEATGAKWAVMKPDEVLLSSEFVQYDGRFYSNKNHLWKPIKSYNFKRNKKNFNNIIKNHWLKNSIRSDKDLHADVLDFIDVWCNDDELCDLCEKCLKNAKTKKEVEDIIDNNFFVEDNNNVSYLDSSEVLYDYYNDFYDYKNVYNYDIFDE